MNTLKPTKEDLRFKINVAFNQYNLEPTNRTSNGLGHISPFFMVYGVTPTPCLAYLNSVDKKERFSEEEMLESRPGWIQYIQNHIFDLCHS